MESYPFLETVQSNVLLIKVRPVFALRLFKVAIEHLDNCRLKLTSILMRHRRSNRQIEVETIEAIYRGFMHAS